MLYLQTKRSLCKQVLWQAKKLVAVSATSTLVTQKKEELEQVSYIWYPVIFKDQTKTLLNSRSKVNAMSETFTHQLGLTIWKINVRAQKINGTILDIYRIVVSTFSVSDKDDRERFFEENFLLTNIKSKIVFGMLFLNMNNGDIDFRARNLQ